MTRPTAYSYIRFSSEKQKQGDSLRRQKQLSQQYVEKHDLILDKTLKLEDLGVSGFKGVNASEGALKGFYDAVETGLVKKGSYLLVESLDRLSRDSLDEAMLRFLQIIKKGIVVVTLFDNMKYDKESISGNPAPLMLSLAIMYRAYEESNTKSIRLKSSWENKRQNAQAKPITTKCPAWLTYSHDDQKFKVIPDRVELVKNIFQWSLEGLGNGSIMNKLNAQKTPTWGRSNGWHTSYIQKVLNNRAVLGEFQLHKMVNGKQTKVGEPISDYFPKVIDEKLFYLVQKAKKSRKHKGGRRGAKFGNLFTNLVYCGYCHSSMNFKDKGKGPKGGKYLVCSNGARNMGCYKHGWNYKHFEKSALTYIEGLDISSVLNDAESQSKLRKLKDHLFVEQEKKSDLEKQSENIAKAIAEGVELSTLKDKALELTESIDTQTEKIKKINSQINSSNREAILTPRELSDLIAFITDLNRDGDDLALLVKKRKALNQKMKMSINAIVLFNAGQPLTPAQFEKEVESIDILEAEYGQNKKVEPKDIEFRKKIIIKNLRAQMKTRPELRYYAVIFQTGKFQIIKPDYENPDDFVYIKGTNDEIVFGAFGDIYKTSKKNQSEIYEEYLYNSLEKFKPKHGV